MYPRSLDLPSHSRQSFFLFGPRGTGKTTWLKQRFPQAIYLDLLDHALYLELLARPQRLREFAMMGGWCWTRCNVPHWSSTRSTG